jgi:hypothetical protein
MACNSEIRAHSVAVPGSGCGLYRLAASRVRGDVECLREWGPSMVVFAAACGTRGVELMLARVNPLGRVLYPDLMHRRACRAMSDAARKKRETPGAGTPEASVPIAHPLPREHDGRSTESDS